MGNLVYYYYLCDEQADAMTRKQFPFIGSWGKSHPSPVDYSYKVPVKPNFDASFVISLNR